MVDVMNEDRKPTERFSTRVDAYVRYRPGYPPGVLQVLRDETELTAPARIADIGSGTGISAELFLTNGHIVYGVEPNAAMRAAGERHLARYPQFHSIDGTAAATTLADGSVDYVVAAQAFHWFDPVTTRREFVRILQPGGWCVLLWNTRRATATPFLLAYESLLETFGTDYCQVRHENIDAAAIERFFGVPLQKRSLLHAQILDYVGLEGRLASSSYAPGPEHPRYRSMLDELHRIFNAHAENGGVRMEYETEMFFGRLE
jgi:SAM-dependent methyltransferase